MAAPGEGNGRSRFVSDTTASSRHLHFLATPSLPTVAPSPPPVDADRLPGEGPALGASRRARTEGPVLPSATRWGERARDSPRRPCGRNAHGREEHQRRPAGEAGARAAKRLLAVRSRGGGHVAPDTARPLRDPRHRRGHAAHGSRYDLGGTACLSAYPFR